jgi:hypothetical protein
LSSTDISPNSSRRSGTRATPRATMVSTPGRATRSPSQRELAGGRQQAHRRAQQRGLAGAVGADHRDDLALFHMQRTLVHRLDGAVGDAEVFELKDRLGSSASSSSSSSAPPR